MTLVATKGTVGLIINYLKRDIIKTKRRKEEKILTKKQKQQLNQVCIVAYLPFNQIDCVANLHSIPTIKVNSKYSKHSFL